MKWRPPTNHYTFTDIMELLGVSPGRRAAIYFLLTILLGTAVLLLPISEKEQPITLIDALFTSTSAVCVTGLTVLDTGKDFSFFGQIVILILIQLGGLGIMTFTTGLLVSLGSRLSFHDRYGFSQSFSSGSGIHYVTLLKAVISTTFIFEFLGAVALYIKFQTQYPTGKAVFYAIFHSISAFCNAGFSTFSNSLESYRSDGYTVLVFSLLIISGGLGFIVIREVYARLTKKEVMLSLHSKLCLTTTGILLVGGTVVFYFTEYHNAFKSTGFGYNLLNAFFQSVTCRTAGFNTLSQVNLTEVSILITMILMFIGACPGSTGGGVKTTTFATVMLLVWNRFRGKRSVAAFKRSISADSVRRALTVTLLAFLVIVVMFVLFVFIEEEPIPHLVSKGVFVDNLFEVISAFGTVGLSLGATSTLHDWGKILLILLMFAGRVGLLTLAFALARPAEQGEIVYLEEEILVG